MRHGERAVTVYYTLMFVVCSAYGSHASRDACSGSVVDIIQEHDPNSISFISCTFKITIIAYRILIITKIFETSWMTCSMYDKGIGKEPSKQPGLQPSESFF